MRPTIIQTGKYELRPYAIQDEDRFVEIEKVTKSNACTACADKKVLDYVLGACS